MRRYLFADEAGDFEFVRKPNVSKYYIIGAVTVEDCDCGAQLLELRRKMIWHGMPVKDYFHASEDVQVIRDKVFSLIQALPVRVYATIMEKSKAQPPLRVTNARFYKYGWYYLLKFIWNEVAKGTTQVMVTAASVGTKRGQAVFTAAVNDVMIQTCKLDRDHWVTAFHPSATDPCLQIADYCIWALQRKWERNDLRSYDLIKDKVAYEYDLFRRGTDHYY